MKNYIETDTITENAGGDTVTEVTETAEAAETEKKTAKPAKSRLDVGVAPFSQSRSRADSSRGKNTVSSIRMPLRPTAKDSSIPAASGA